MEATMSSDSPHNEMFSVWQSQPIAPPATTPEQIRERMRRLNRKLFWRDFNIYVICAGETAWFAYCIATIHVPVFQAGMALIVAGLAYLAGQLLFSRGMRSGSRASSAWSSAHSVDFYRLELTHQRNFHRGFWFWSRMIALFPGLAVCGFWAVDTYPKLVLGYILCAGTVITFAIAIWVNARMARSYQRKIDALNVYKSPPL
jgi:hypothetical protein